ncbi:MAG: hypothetical protein DWG75_01315 [Chloroflexi bacterium]|nr:hypothetical protein [Chloroflexota bacterium]
MNRPTLLLINGHPGTGKTALAAWLAAELRVPCVRKDLFKEALYDHRMPADREQSRDYGRLAYALTFRTAAAHLGSGVSTILEAPLHREFSQHEIDLVAAETGAALAQIVLSAASGELERRELARRATSERHAGHSVGFTIEEFHSVVVRPIDAPVVDPTLEVDTTDFAAVDRQVILSWAGERLATTGPAAM